MPHTYEVRLRKDKRSVDLISDALPFGRLWYTGPNAVNNAIDYARFCSRSKECVIRIFDHAGNLVSEDRHKSDFTEPGYRLKFLSRKNSLASSLPSQAEWRAASCAKLEVNKANFSSGEGA